jgi:UDP-2,3-diacylglucosamine pyrophosphatase LpxH
MIALIGDLHGEFSLLPKILKGIPSEAVIIQVGDFGYWPGLELRYQAGAKAVGHPFEILFIEGNHDHVVDVPYCRWPGAVYVPRGSVMELDGKRVLFMGGATSVDRKWRSKAPLGPHPWFEEEVVTEADVERALQNVRGGGPIDLMVTHSPPNHTIRRHFSDDGLRFFDIDPVTWRDPSAENVQWLWEQVGEPPLYCGHMHKSVLDGNIRILDIMEVVVL